MINSNNASLKLASSLISYHILFTAEFKDQKSETALE